MGACTSSGKNTANCPACKGGERLWLSGQEGSQTTVLCGRNAVQVSPKQKTELAFGELAEKLRDSGSVDFNAYLLRLVLKSPDFELTVFRDGRAIIKGTEDIGVARGVYSRYVGL